MFGIDPVAVALVFISLALLLAAAIRVFLGASARTETHDSASIHHENEPQEDEKTGLLVIADGGTVRYANRTLRDWLNLPVDARLNLEHLARRARPSEVFLELCARPGHARFALQGMLVEGTSISIPYPTLPATLITFNRPDISALTRSVNPDVNALKVLSELSVAMTTRTDLSSTVEAILESVERLIPADIAEITVWNGSEQHLRPYRLAGLPGVDRRLDTPSQRFRSGQGYSGKLFADRKPLLVNRPQANRTPASEQTLKSYPFQSYLGVPLVIADQAIGTLELGSLTSQSYSEKDLETLLLLSNQAAIALHHALTREEEERRVAELTGLANLTQAVSALRDSRDLFSQLTNSIQPLLDVDILGFLIYDDNAHRLQGQVPFLGIPDHFVEHYASEIEPDSPGAAIWRSNQTILAPAAAEDEDLISLKLAHLAQATGILNTVLVPLTVGGRSLGYLQAGNKRSGAGFGSDELRLLKIIAGQSAAILDNASLLNESRRRTRQAEALRRIAALASSAATLEEILQFSLTEVARLLGAAQAAFFLIDQERYELAVHVESLFGIGPHTADGLPVIKMEDPLYAGMVTATQELRVFNRVSTEIEAEAVYKPLLELLEADSGLSVPLIVSDRTVGEMLLASPTADFFHQGEVELASTAAGQIAGAIERAFVSLQTDEVLRRRVEELTALTRAGRELNASSDPGVLVQLIHKEALAITEADCGTVLLFDPAEGKITPPAIAAAAGDRPVDSARLTDLEIASLDMDRPLVVNEVDQAGEVPPHPGVKAVMIVPLVSQGTLLGLIHLHSHAGGYFNERVQDAARSLAAEAAIALVKADRHQFEVHQRERLQQRNDILEHLFANQRGPHGRDSLGYSLARIAEGLQETAGFSSVLIGLYSRENQSVQTLCGRGFEALVLEQLQQHPIPWSRVLEVIQPEQRTQGAYVIPVAASALMQTGAQSEAFTNLRQRTRLSREILLVPLMNGADEPLGVIMVEVPGGGLWPDEVAFEALNIFAAQAAALIQNSPETRDHQAKGVAVGEQNTPAVAADGSGREDLQAQRVESALGLIQTVSRQKSRVAVFEALSDQMVNRMGFDISLVAERTTNGAVLASVSGSLPDHVNPEALLGQRNPLRLALQSGETQLVDHLRANDAAKWSDSPLLKQLGAQGFICLPIRPDDEATIEAAVLAISTSGLPKFTASDQEIYKLISRQAAIAIQNIKLLEQTRERLREVDLLLNFSRRLGSLKPDEVLRSLTENALAAVSAAQACLVALWEPRSGRLVPVSADGYRNSGAMMQIHFEAGVGLPGKTYQAGAALRVDEVNIAVDYNLPYEDLLRYQEATHGRVPIASLTAPIAASGSVLGVIVLDNFGLPGAFNAEDEVLIASLARQTGLILENARLLEDANQRAVQLNTLTDIATTITSDLQVNVITASLLEQLRRLISYNTGTFWFRQGGSLLIRATHGFEDDEERVGLSVSIEDSQLLGEMIATGQPTHVPNVHEDPRFLALPEYERLSWLGIPLLSKGEVIGVIALEKNEAFFYDQEHIQIATTFAGQAAVAFENARLLEESIQRASDLNERSQRLDLLNRLSTEFSASLDAARILQFTVEEIQSAIKCRAATAVLYDESGTAWLTAEHPPSGASLPSRFNASPFEHLRESLGVMIVEDVHAHPAMVELAGFWGSSAALILSLATGDNLHGLLILHSDTRLLSGEIDLARTISNQVSVAIQNALLFDRSRRLAEELEQRVDERTRELEVEHQRTETLLGIITELSASLDMDIVLNRTLSLLNRITGAEQATIILSNPADASLLRRASQGYTEPVPEGGIETPFEVSEGLAGWVIRQREPALIADIRKDVRWISRGKTDHRSAIAIPLMLGAEALGALLLFHRKVGRFSADQLDLIQAAAKQIAVAVNNAHLYLLIRDQAERLGGMLRSQQVEASRLLAILEAVVDGVLVTDARGQISIFNHAGEYILGLAPDAVVGRSLEHFTGLFGKAGHKWMDKIRSWSADPNSYEEGETFSEEIRLDNDHVVAVNLAPVANAREFLGTVSIFRDITHMIEVDRMKSDFVATVSHELRTPMTSIKGYVDILLMGAAGKLSDQQHSFLQVVQANTERLNILVNDLLEVSRIEAGKVILALKPVDLPRLAGEVATDYRLRSQEEKKDLEITVAGRVHVPPALADEERVRQILNNLIGNAYNYTSAGGIIQVTFRLLDGFIEVAVKDNGVGISPEDQDRIFERFYRGEAPLVSSVAGTGLGLSIVKYLVELHGGRIRIESRGLPGEGSTFLFTIPAGTKEI